MATSMRIAVVEDEQDLVILLRYNLEAAGYRVETMTKGDEAEVRLREEPPDLVILDWMLPNLSGIELLRRLRRWPETRTLPIILLTARGEETDRVRGLETGADDFVVKPFSVTELLARIQSLLRRAKPEKVSSVLYGGDIEIDREAVSVRRDGKRIHLGPTEFRLLEYFVQSPGRVLNRGQILDAVWGNQTFIDERTVDVHIGRLRKALLASGRSDPITTIRGVGYRFDAQ
jgi:two-component system phosphate regulon response regulator PhoB